VAGAVALGGSTMRRVTVTKNAAGQPVLIVRRFVFFVPGPTEQVDLSRYTTVKLGYGQGAGCAHALLAFLLVGIFSIFLINREMYSLEITGSFKEGVPPSVNPISLYRGPSQAFARDLGDALEEIGGLRYG
jgi:hypothetical protein